MSAESRTGDLVSTIFSPKTEHKDTKGKPRLGYIYRSFLNAIMEVREFGAKKYQEHNSWRKANIDDMYHAVLRHATAMCDARFNPESRENLLDAESRLRHIAHIACNAMYIIEAEETEKANSLSDKEIYEIDAG